MFEINLFWLTTIPVGLFLGMFFYRLRMPLWLQIIITIPGTIAHELAHFIFALLSNAKPVGFSIIPKKENDRWVLGAVTCKNIRWYNAFPVAMAPLVLISIPFAMDALFPLPELSLLEKAVYFALSAIVVQSSIPSTQDLKIVFSRFIGSAAWVFLIFSAISLI